MVVNRCVFGNESERRQGRQSVDCAVAPRYHLYSLCLPTSAEINYRTLSVCFNSERTTGITSNKGRQID